jgi:hypothetical protein
MVYSSEQDEERAWVIPVERFGPASLVFLYLTRLKQM